MKIAITADNTCDLPAELLKENDITLTYIPNIMGDVEYRENINSEFIYDFVNRTGILPKTAALSSYDYKEFFEEKLKNYDAVIHFGLSSGVSSTVNNAKTAAGELKNVYVIDTKSLTSGSGLLVLSACDKIKEKKSLEEILQEVEAEVEKVQTSFVISKLAYLRKGGRCSSIALFGANLLGLKILVQLIDGKMEATKKYIGKFETCLTKYLKDMIKENAPNLNRVFITSSSKMPEIVENLVEELKVLGFKNIYLSNTGPTISSHCGPGTLGICYMKK